MSRIHGPLELLQHSLAGQSKSLKFSHARSRLGRQPGPGLRTFLTRLGLLRFDGLALPSPRHFCNYSSRREGRFAAMLQNLDRWNPVSNYENGIVREYNVFLLTAWV